MSLSKAFREKVDARTAQIYDDWQGYRAVAGEHYKAKGRGTFLVDLTKPFDQEQKPKYTDIEETKQILSDPLSIIMRVGEYNPEREIVFAFLDPSLNEGQCVILRDRGEDDALPPIVDDLPDPSAAKSFDELTDILNDIWSRRDVEGLVGPARGIWRVLEASWQISSNGIEGYLWNVGTESLEAYRALKDAGAAPFVAIFDEVFAKFPDGGPSENDEGFFDELERIGDEEDDPWKKQTSQFYAIEDDLKPALWKYWLATTANRQPST